MGQTKFCRMQKGLEHWVVPVFVQGGMIMLVLGRKPGEFVMIGEDIMVKVVRSADGDLRLAINAPKSINITRGEIYETQNEYNNLT
jgi:carbon storage regulator